MDGKPTRIGLTLDEEDFKHLVRGEAATLEQTDVEVAIILADIGFDRIYAIVREAVGDWAQAKGEASVNAFEEGRASREVVENLAAVDKEMPIVGRLNEEKNAALAYSLQILAIRGAQSNEEPEMVQMAIALYAFQLGHDYARRWGDITDD